MENNLFTLNLSADIPFEAFIIFGGHSSGWRESGGVIVQA